MHENPTVLTPTEARQGDSKRITLRVLITSLVLAILLGGVIYAVFYNRPGQAIPQNQTEG